MKINIPGNAGVRKVQACTAVAVFVFPLQDMLFYVIQTYFTKCLVHKNNTRTVCNIECFHRVIYGHVLRHSTTPHLQRFYGFKIRPFRLSQVDDPPTHRDGQRGLEKTRSQSYCELNLADRSAEFCISAEKKAARSTSKGSFSACKIDENLQLSYSATYRVHSSRLVKLYEEGT